MDTMARITGGVDTHLDVRVAAALDAVGGVLGTASFPTTTAGYRQLLSGCPFGQVRWSGGRDRQLRSRAVPGHLHYRRVEVVEVDRGNRQDPAARPESPTRSTRSPPARAVLAGTANGAAKTRNGNVES